MNDLTTQTGATPTTAGQAEPADRRHGFVAPDGRSWWWSAVVVAVLAFGVWIPRLSGPIDLRYDAGVYYLLGTSLVNGDGYRIGSEPGAPQGVQYPPGLPAIVAVHQWALGTAQPEIVGAWLRRTFFVLYVAYGLTVLALARRFLPPIAALGAAALCLLQVMMVFLSDLLFTELPSALVAVCFVLVMLPTRAPLPARAREVVAFTLATMGFLLRTAGIALLAAWVLEAAWRRQWRQTAARAACAALPVLGWQAYVLSVTSSAEYAQPAYEYQRAPYQFYNVPYGENVALVDPFQPELGRVGLADLARRGGRNLVRIPGGLGEAVSTTVDYWKWLQDRLQLRLLGRIILPEWPSRVPILILGAAVIAGLAWLARRVDGRVIVLIVLGSTALICATPWPGQFSRYFSPSAPFLAIALMLTLVKLFGYSRQGSRPRLRRAGWIVVVGAVIFVLAAQALVLRRMFLDRQSSGASYIPGQGAGGTAFFYYDDTWRRWAQALEWIAANTSTDAIIATNSPHYCHLLTGRRAVLPPMESDPATARRLLETVPVSHVVVDELEFLDVARRYALPAVESAPEQWRIAHAFGNTRVYERAPDP